MDDDLADFGEDDLFASDAKPVAVPHEGSTTTTPAPKKSGWKQFDANPPSSAATSVPNSRKREKLDLPSRSSDLADAEVFSTILVSRLPNEVKMSKLALHFESFGSIGEIYLDRSQNRGLVRFSHHSSAMNAIKVPFQIFNHRMVLDRVKEQDLEGGGSDPLAKLASIIFTALEAKQHGLDHPVVAITVEQMECPVSSSSAAAAAATTMGGGHARMSYRAPETAEESLKPKPDLAVQREIQKANLKVLLADKNLALAKKALATCREGMKQASDKLNTISKDPNQRSEVIAEVTSFTMEVKNAQATVFQSEAAVQTAKREVERLKQASKPIAPPAPKPAVTQQEEPTTTAT
ncbi:hypothetical protein BASA82_000590 [Batrachochytrium salamandrivorans]|nr:hypothetical protein BASA82_000590 [Batrachochytrium salamandrivorans]